MTTFTDDMSTPVTRGELRDELQQFKVRLDQSLDQLEQRLEQKLEQKLGQKLEQKLEMWGGALLARIDSNERRLAEQFREGIASSEQRLLAELARHTRAIQESMSTQISVVDEKYDDLPARVRRLEATVYPPERR